MNYRPMKVTLLIVMSLVAAWLIQSGGGATAWASGLPSVVAAADIANIPTAFSYQGSLRLADGNLATGSYTITLKIYNVVTGGTALHSESFGNVVVRNGNFSVVVGDATPVNATVFDNANLYLGITVAPDPEMLPRQRLYPVPWAMQAGQAQSATTAGTATTLAKDATINGLIINKGATNEGALKVTSSGPGWGSGIRFENTAANRTYGIYVSQAGVWHFADETTGADRFFVDPTGQFRTRGSLVADGDIASGGNMSTAGQFTAGTSIIAGVHVVAQGKVYAVQGFNGYCRGSGPIDVHCNQDVAETFATDGRTEPGDLVVFIPEDRAESAVRLSTQPYEGMIVGVVSTNPGLVFDQGKTYLAGDNANLITDSKTVVAMVGRVQTKFSLENGPIAIGDPLTSSSEPGVAMKATQAGKIIGYAMQSSDAAEDGKLLVWLQLGMYIPQATLDALNSDTFATPTGVDAEIAELKTQIAELAAQLANLQAAQR
jgi:hypothetical protein